ncbi:isoaspartyl peptidase/L-asparaginase [Thalassotalea sp. 1_MG-2023]|uniref:isoaspartyl peptidase/L-asparaginase family protein n=1 Tax=Thalassotalea sp. 1_MG-2023 TaxID=3062680 RepID=UPI0026E3FA7C|nr:isoaspartyl peptidase/L-asparaginase [Thalassotalea sp. 1_MG-2023]MDO6428479.1 isoaspartyl peptidase/L-asparaginase [Thalassotalea sp. 1_MG-2023]
MRIFTALNLTTLAICLSLTPQTKAEEEAKFAIAIHGGAGAISQKKMTPKIRAQYDAKLSEAVNAGYALLEKGHSSEQAIIAAIQIMEESPLFNAGKGAVYTYDEHHELDASIMDGKTLNAGAVSGVKTVKSPIALAQSVMNNSVHVMLSGEGAESFAKQQNLALVDNQYFNTERRYKSLLRAKKKLQQKAQELKDYQAAHQTLDVEYKVGTVGAVALDKNGNLAAGTSTGGMTAKRFGRIGDAPIIGAGTYANNNSCAVSATGHGEYFIRYHVAADICARMEYQNISVEQAADTVINKVLVKAGGTGGVIVIDKNGNITMPFNTEGMYRASRSSTGKTNIAIFRNE